MPRVTLKLGGMAEQAVEPEGAAHRVQNMRRDPEGYWETMPGTLDVGNAGAGAVPSIHWFRPRTNLRWLVFEQVQDATRSKIRYMDLHTAAPVDIVTRRRLASGDLGTVFAEDGDWLYMFSPTAAPVRWDGVRTAPVGWAAPPGPPLVAGPDQSFNFTDKAAAVYATAAIKYNTRQRGVGAFPDGTTDEHWRYAYAIVEVNDRGQMSPPSPVVFASGTNNASFGRYMVKVRVERSPGHIRGVYLLRSQNVHDIDSAETAVRLYFLRFFPTAAGFDWLDLTPDGELGQEFLPDTVGPVPSPARTGVFWQGSMWVPDGARVRYSHPGAPEQFPEINFLPAGSGATGDVVAIAAVPRGLALFKPGGVYLVKGTPLEGYRIETVTERRGCAAPRAIEYVPSLGLAFLSREGPAYLSGTLDDDAPTRVELLPGIRRTWRRLVGARLEVATSCYDAEYNEVWWQVPEGGAATPGLGIVFHPDAGWSIREGWSAACFSRHLGRTWLGSSAGGLYVLSPSSTSAFGSAVTGIYTAGELVSETALVIRTAEVGVIGLGSTELDLYTRSELGGDWVRQTESGRRQRPSELDLPLWGVDSWSTSAKWAGYAPTVVPVSTHRFSGMHPQARVGGNRIRLWSMSYIVEDTGLPRQQRV